MKLTIEIQKENLPAFRAFAKAMKARIIAESEASLMDDIEESLHQVRDIRMGRAKGLSVKEVVNGKK